MQVYERYPLAMDHPSHAPAILSNSMEHGHNHHGRAEMYPPVTVNNEDQEEQYLAKGYRPRGAPDAAAFRTAQAAPVPHGFTPQAYPRWENGKLVEDPNAAKPDNTWPMWVRPQGREAMIVKGPDEYRREMGKPYAPSGGAAQPEALAAPAAPAIDDAELAEFRAWKAAQAEKANAQPDKRSLVTQAKALGIAADQRWSVSRLQREIAAALG